MHDIWNPWHGCVKCSEGCEHCHMYFLERVRDRNGADIYKIKAGFASQAGAPYSHRKTGVAFVTPVPPET